MNKLLLIGLAVSTFIIFGDTRDQKLTYGFNTGGDLCSVLWSRPRHTSLVPSQTINLQGAPVVATRHHIIPYNTLNNFFYFAMMDSRQDNILGRYLARQIRRIVNQFVSNQLSIQYQPPVNEEDVIITVNVNEEMIAGLTWLPGNIFMGPPPHLRGRDDPQNQQGGDPGNAFEEYADRIVNNDNQFTTLLAINRDMNAYMENSDTHLFEQIMANLDIINQRDTPYPYDPNDWEIRNGRYYIRDRPSGNNPRNKRSTEGTGRAVRTLFEKAESEDPFTDFEHFCFDVKEQLFTGKGFGQETDTGNWNNVYKVQFTFSVGGKVYLYGQNVDNYYWFIQELTEDGKMGPETANGQWTNFYEVQLSFKVGGKTFFYGHNTDTKYWFIQELLPGGKMGQETANGFWNNVYRVQFSFTVGGNTYLYGQSNGDNYWFIQELRSDGTVGRETANGFWNNYYEVQFPIVVGGKTYFFGKNDSIVYSFIQELLPGGRMGNETYNGRGDEPFYVQVFHGYIFGQNQVTKLWKIQEVTPDGKLGRLTSSGSWNNAYEILIPFFIRGKTYLYGFNTQFRYWFIQRMS